MAAIKRNRCIQNNKIITEGIDLAETFNNHYINFIKKSSGNKLVIVATLNNVSDQDAAINIIIKAYKNHPRVTRRSCLGLRIYGWIQVLVCDQRLAKGFICG